MQKIECPYFLDTQAYSHVNTLYTNATTVAADIRGPLAGPVVLQLIGEQQVGSFVTNRLLHQANEHNQPVAHFSVERDRASESELEFVSRFVRTVISSVDEWLSTTGVDTDNTWVEKRNHILQQLAELAANNCPPNILSKKAIYIDSDLHLTPSEVALTDKLRAEAQPSVMSLQRIINQLWSAINQIQHHGQPGQTRQIMTLAISDYDKLSIIERDWLEEHVFSHQNHLILVTTGTVPQRQFNMNHLGIILELKPWTRTETTNYYQGRKEAGQPLPEQSQVADLVAYSSGGLPTVATYLIDQLSAERQVWSEFAQPLTQNKQLELADKGIDTWSWLAQMLLEKGGKGTVMLTELAFERFAEESGFNKLPPVQQWAIMAMAQVPHFNQLILNVTIGDFASRFDHFEFDSSDLPAMQYLLLSLTRTDFVTGNYPNYSIQPGFKQLCQQYWMHHHPAEREIVADAAKRCYYYMFAENDYFARQFLTDAVSTELDFVTLQLQQMHKELSTIDGADADIQTKSLDSLIRLLQQSVNNTANKLSMWLAITHPLAEELEQLEQNFNQNEFIDRYGRSVADALIEIVRQHRQSTVKSPTDSAETALSL